MQPDLSAPGEAAGAAGRRAAALSVALVVAAMVFQLATLRPGQSWGDDFALYLLHARNIAEGRPYAETSYLHLAGSPLGPSAYPPGLPLLLAPFYHQFGLDFTAFQRVVVVCLALGLSAACLLFRRDLTPGYLLMFAGFTAFSPILWDFKENVLSEFPYMLFLYGSALALARPPGSPGISERLHGLLAGLLVGAAAGTRTIGLLLLPALALSGLLAGRRLGRRTLWALAAASSVILVLSWFGGATTYADQFGGIGFMGFRRNLRSYLAEIAGLLPGGNAGVIDEFFRWLLIHLGVAHGPNPRLALGVGDVFALTMGALAMFGWAGRIARGCTLLDAYAPMHLLATAAFPSYQGGRYVLPLLPLLLFYVLIGLRLPGLHHGRFGRFVLLAGALTGASFYMARFAAFDYGPLREGVGRPEAQAFFVSLRQNTTAKDLVLFGKPRALALMTKRRSAEPCRKLTDADCWRYIDRVGATHIGTAPPPDEHEVNAFVERAGSRLQVVFLGGPYALYRIRPGGPAGALTRADDPAEPETARRLYSLR